MKAFCALVLATLAGLVIPARAATDPEKAQAVLKNLGAKFKLDESTSAKPVVEIDLSSTAADDRAMANGAEFPALQSLKLGGTKITDAGLANLKGLTKLRLLNLNYTAITGKGLASLKDSPDLRELSLLGARIDDQGMSAIKELTQVK